MISLLTRRRIYETVIEFGINKYSERSGRVRRRKKRNNKSHACTPHTYVTAQARTRTYRRLDVDRINIGTHGVYAVRTRTTHTHTLNVNSKITMYMKCVYLTVKCHAYQHIQWRIFICVRIWMRNHCECDGFNCESMPPLFERIHFSIE